MNSHLWAARAVAPSAPRRPLADKLVPVAGHAALAAYVVAALCAAAAGFAGYFGPVVAAAVVIVLLLQRFAPPLAIVVLIGALTAWHWHWVAALLFAGQGVVLLEPPVLSAFLPPDLSYS